jgi:hypothetical protein
MPNPLKAGYNLDQRVSTRFWYQTPNSFGGMAAVRQQHGNRVNFLITISRFLFVSSG